MSPDEFRLLFQRIRERPGMFRIPAGLTGAIIYMLACDESTGRELFKRILELDQSTPRWRWPNGSSSRFSLDLAPSFNSMDQGPTWLAETGVHSLFISRGRWHGGHTLVEHDARSWSISAGHR